MSSITAPGAYPLTAEQYHADPCPKPSLSSSIIKTLLGKSPRHAWTEHPRLNPDYLPQVGQRKFDIGTAAHSLMLRDPRAFSIIDAADFRTKAAKEARDAAYEAGKIPLLVDDWTRVQAIVKAGRAQLAQHEDARDAFTEGAPEITLAWQEGETWGRCRLDWLPNDGRTFRDYKTTSVTANPDSFGRQFYELGYDIQAAWYRRGIRAVLNIPDPAFELVIQEIEPPYALAVMGLPPSAIDVAERKIDEALNWWRWCLDHDSWPGYSRLTCYVEPPPWHEARWLEREARDQALREGRDPQRLYRLAMDWQAPLKEALADV
ncbi:MAG: PD-(D/E)XK nuclease-like domain-containing protein [Reyranella sp.]|uniref:PD-(D/E)XK nuclease-like domain-containing protein n=1 Tax=Reyranella sp. TaxID=1929291 RepID=UPI003D10C49C